MPSLRQSGSWPRSAGAMNLMDWCVQYPAVDAGNTGQDHVAWSLTQSGKLSLQSSAGQDRVHPLHREVFKGIVTLN